MTLRTRSELNSVLFTAKIIGSVPKGADELIIQGLRAWEAGERVQALRLLRSAAGADLRRAEPWYWMGCLHEEDGDRTSAAYCYYFANDLRRYEPARAALRRLGYLSQAA